MNQMRCTVSALAVAVTLFLGGIVHGQEGHSVKERVPPGGETLEMAKFYIGATPVQTGTFPGKLVCLRCDLAHAGGASKQCATEGHRHALSMDGGSMIHPLLPGTKEALEQINSPELHGKQVKVSGFYYPSTGAILVSNVIPAN